MKVRDTESFIIKSRKIHNNKYDYSKVEYVDSRTKVCIICPDHGEFFQTPNNHTSKCSGCYKCNGGIRYTLEDFISKSKEKWGNNSFDYSKVDYKNNVTKVTLICKKHNKTFQQTPEKHLKGCHCCDQCLLEDKGLHKKGYWSYEKCLQTSKKYEWLSDFIREEKTCYEKTLNMGWIDKFTWLKRVYDISDDILETKKHSIYLIKLPNKVCYVGLTVNVDNRYKRHKESGTVFNYCKKNNINIPYPIIIENGLTVEESQIREGYWINYYKTKGYKLLNKVKAGSIGGLGNLLYRYSDEELTTITSSYKSRTSLKIDNRNLYRWLNRHNLLDKYFPKKFVNQYG